MALNIPINLMSVGTPSAQPMAIPVPSNPVTTVAPAKSSANTSGAGLGQNAGGGTQGKGAKPAITGLDAIGPQRAEMERYAPPNPLPTAPILQAAENYGAALKQL